MKKILWFVSLSLLVLAWPTEAQVVSGGGGGWRAGPAPAYGPQALAFFSRLATQPSSAQKTIYDNFISGLVNSPVWAKLDGLYVLAAPDAATAAQNLLSASYPLTVHGSPVFTTLQGYNQNGNVNNYLDTGLDPSVGGINYSQDSGSLFAWTNTSVHNPWLNDYPDPFGGIGTYSNLFISYPQSSLGGGINGSADVLSGTGFGSGGINLTGLYSVSRVSSSGVSFYANGLPSTSNPITSTSSSISPGSTVKFLVMSGTSNQGNLEIGLAGFGGGLDIGNELTLTNYAANYNTDLLGTTLPVKFGSAYLVNGHLPLSGSQGFQPSISRLPDGRLLWIYEYTNGAATFLVNAFYQFSSDNGATWTSPTSFLSVASTYFGLTATVINGQVYVTAWNKTTTPHSTDLFIGTISGSTINFGSAINIASTTTVYTYGSMLQLQNGSLLQGYYTCQGGQIYIKISSDMGATWGSPVLVANSATTGCVGFVEATFAQRSNGQIVSLIRYNAAATGVPSEGYWVSTTADASGLTGWTSPTQIFDNTTAPVAGGAALAVTPAGTLVFVGRFSYSTYDFGTAVAYSTDPNALIWSGPIGPLVMTDQNTYGLNGYSGAVYDPVTKTIMLAMMFGSNSEPGASTADLHILQEIIAP